MRTSGRSSSLVMSNVNFITTDSSSNLLGFHLILRSIIEGIQIEKKKGGGGGVEGRVFQPGLGMQAGRGKRAFLARLSHF